MKVGPEYIQSGGRRLFDFVLACGMTPAEWVASSIAKHTFTKDGDLYFYQERIGNNFEPVVQKKIRTLDEKGVVLSALAEKFRSKGLDELPQLGEVRAGRKSIVGRRELIAEEFDELHRMANQTNTGRQLWPKWRDLVLPANTGLFSTFAFNAHTEGYATDPVVRLECDIADHENASFIYETRLILSGIARTARGELTVGSVGIHGRDSN